MPIKEEEEELRSSDSLDNRSSQPVSVRNLIHNVSESDVYNIEELELDDDDEDEYSYSNWIRRNIARGLIFICCTVFLASSILGFIFLFNVSRKRDFFLKYCFSSTSGGQKIGNCLDSLHPCTYDLKTDSSIFNDFSRTQMVKTVKHGIHKEVVIKAIGTKFVVEYPTEDCTVNCNIMNNVINFQLLTDIVTFRNRTFIEGMRICAINLK